MCKISIKDIVGYAEGLDVDKDGKISISEFIQGMTGTAGYINAHRSEVAIRIAIAALAAMGGGIVGDYFL